MEAELRKTDRLHHIVTLLRSRRSTTLARLQEETQVSRATLMRDLAWLRDVVGHPIRWDHESGSYRWAPNGTHSDDPEELAGLWFKPSEVVALLTLRHLISEIQPGDLLHRHLQPLEKRLQSILQKADFHGPAEQLFHRVRIIGLGRRPVRPHCFEVIGSALFQRKKLSIRYEARGTGSSSARVVSPQRLVYYRSNWILDAWCHLRQEIRSFSLDRISQPQILGDPAVDLPTEDLDQILGNGYGIFSGSEVQWATLRFSPERARWVAAEQWHPEQRCTWDGEGYWILKIPYSDDRELVMDILRHIPEVEVLEPAVLRERVLKKMREGVARWGESLMN